VLNKSCQILSDQKAQGITGPGIPVVPKWENNGRMRALCGVPFLPEAFVSALFAISGYVGLPQGKFTKGFRFKETEAHFVKPFQIGEKFFTFN
jgi:hypothetical protein